VAAATPERIHTEPFDPDAGLRPHQIRKVAWRIGLPPTAFRAAEEFMAGFGRLFLQYDCSLLEINPLVLTADQRLVALDCKMSFDDNALFRHPELPGLRDLTEEEPAEVRAGEAGLATSNSTATSAAWSTGQAWP